MAVKLIILFVFALFSTTAYCEKRSIVAELLSSKYTGFVKLLEQANLLEELDAQAAKQNGITVLPTTDNYLVNKVSPVLLSWLKKEQNVPTLRRVMLNHFIPGQVHPQSWTGNEKTLNGFTLDRRVIGGVHFLGGIPVKKIATLKASDGIAHSLDGLLVPEDVKAELATFLDVKDDDIFAKSFNAMGFNDRVKVVAEAETPAAMVLPLASPASSPEIAVSPESPSVSAPIDAPSVSQPAPAPGPSSSSLSALTDLLNSTGNFTSFLALIQEYGLESILEIQLEKPTTVLAPNDFAFEKVSSSDLDALKAAGNMEELLSFHILNAYASVKDFATGANSVNSQVKAEVTNTSNVYYYETLYAGNPLIVTVVNGVAFYGPSNASATSPDLLSDGKLSVSGLDGVMIPNNLLVNPPAPAPSSSGSISVNMISTLLFAIASLALFF